MSNDAGFTKGYNPAIPRGMCIFERDVAVEGVEFHRYHARKFVLRNKQGIYLERGPVPTAGLQLRVGTAIWRLGLMGIIRPRRLLPALVILLVFMTNGTALACGLAGSEWTPEQIGEIASLDGGDIFVRFEADGRLSGHGGCNRFFGSYEITDDRINIGPLGATRMACPGPVMDLEMAFLSALETASGFARDRTRLVLTDPQGNTSATLIQTDWD